MHSCHATQIGLRGRRGDVGRCVIRALSIERGRSRVGERLLLGYPASDRVVVIIVVPKFVSVVTADSVPGMLRFWGDLIHTYSYSRHDFSGIDLGSNLPSS